MQTLTLIDHGSGNIHSARRAALEAARAAGLDLEIQLAADPETIARAERVILPGVGHFADCMAAVTGTDGLVEALETAVHRRGAPFLGICVGMQMLADFGAEDANTKGLGWIHGAVLPIEPGVGRPVPHMGWNTVETRARHPVLAGLGSEPHAYFVHSYAFSPEDETQVAATTDYGGPIVAAVARDNMFGTQFHPEKSQETGLRLLASFLQWDPS
ncbi:MAG: imidazole glycerol phosphate synthase subunit HisH [Alphaproteobacteria bacterium]|jgi:glutamine amidotransferase|nr:imidazole glycerol phosphate synthase subunit HisH [Alphaproteobacteria bacterium]